MGTKQRSKNGFALSIVLWIVAALLLGVATLTLFTKDSLELSKGVNDKLQSRLVAEDLLEVLKFYILTASYGQNSIQNSNLESFEYKLPVELSVDNRWYTLSETIRFRISDDSGKLGIFRSDAALTAQLLKQYVSRQENFIQQDSLKDWIDSDNVPSLNGAELSEYKLQKGLKYPVRNSPAIQDIDELKLVNGFDNLDEKKWKILEDNICNGEGQKPNLLLVSGDYLAVLLAIDKDTTAALVKMRETDLEKFKKTVQEMKSYNDESMGFYLSKKMFIEIEVTEKKAQTVLEVHLDIDNYFKKKSHRILSYIER